MRLVACLALFCILQGLPTVCSAAADVAELRRKCDGGRRKDCEKLAALRRQACSANDIEACEEYLAVARRVGLIGFAQPGPGAQLIDVAKTGNVAAVVDAISAGASADVHTASRSEVWPLLGKPDYGPTGPSGVQGESWPALAFAAAGGHLGVVKCLVAAGADVNATDASGAMPIMHAIWARHHEVVGYLAGHGAQSKEQKLGMTMVMLAAASACPGCIDELVAHGHRTDERTSDGRTALFFVGETGDAEGIATTVAALREAGIEANATDSSGATALVALVRNRPPTFARDRIAAIARTLVDAGVEPRLRDSAGRDALSYAVERCDPHLTRALAGELTGAAAGLGGAGGLIDTLAARVQSESNRERAALTAMPDGSMLIPDGFSYEKNKRMSPPPTLRIEQESDGILVARGTGASQLGGTAMLVTGGEQLLLPDKCGLSCSAGAKWVFAKAGMSFRSGGWLAAAKEDGATVEFREDGVLLRGFDCQNAELAECREVLSLLKGTPRDTTR